MKSGSHQSGATLIIASVSPCMNSTPASRPNFNAALVRVMQLS